MQPARGRLVGMGQPTYKILTAGERGTTGYKYELTATYKRKLKHYFPRVVHAYFEIDPDTSEITVEKGYRWDGPSGPTVDTVDGMAAALVHDVLYQAGREGLLASRYRARADAEFRAILKADGMPAWRRWVWWAAVRLFASKYYAKS